MTKFRFINYKVISSLLDGGLRVSDRRLNLLNHLCTARDSRICKMAVFMSVMISVITGIRINSFWHVTSQCCLIIVIPCGVLFCLATKLGWFMLLAALRRMAPGYAHFTERQILWNLCSADFLIFTLKSHIPTQLSVMPKLQPFAHSGEKNVIIQQNEHTQE